MSDLQFDFAHELYVWALSPEDARRFLGEPADAPVRVVKERPETAAEKAAQRPGAKLYAITRKGGQ